MCLRILRISLVILVAWVFGIVSFEFGWIRKRFLVQRGYLNQVLLEGERCWLGVKVRRFRVVFQYYFFGVYFSRFGNYLRFYVLGDQGNYYVGQSKLVVDGVVVSYVFLDLSGSVGVRSEVEQLVVFQVGDGFIG